MKSAPVEKRKRGRPTGSHHVVAEQAQIYGISEPVFTDTDVDCLAPHDIAIILNVSDIVVKQWIYRRKLPAMRLANGFWKIKVSDFEAFMTARQQIGRRHILVTDGGNSGIAEVVQAIEALGHQAVLSHNYPDALLKALDHFPALFVICISPNDPSCWKFAERIRTNKSLRSFPILFIGGNTISDADTDKAVENSAKGILTRPLTVEIVKGEIERILKRSM